MCIIYCSVEEWKETKEQTQDKIELLLKDDNLASNLDDFGYVNKNLLPRGIESLQVSNEGNQLKKKTVYFYKWAKEDLQNSGELFTIHQLPLKKWSNYWDSICIEERIKRNCLDYVSSIICISPIIQSSLFVSLNRILLFHGPPGTGKTSLAKALAQRIAQQVQVDYEKTFLFEINSQSLYSKFYSESGKMVQKMFGEIFQLSLSNPRNMYFLLIDEIEGVATSRERSISSSEPADTIRVVNALLTNLDKVAGISNIFILATSNLREHIDRALLDRVDLSIFVPNPTSQQIYTILREGIYELIRANIIGCDKYELQTSLLQAKHLQIEGLLIDNPTSRMLLEISKEFEFHNASGRRVKKALLTSISTCFQQNLPLHLSDFLSTLQTFSASG